MSHLTTVRSYEFHRSGKTMPVQESDDPVEKREGGGGGQLEKNKAVPSQCVTFSYRRSILVINEELMNARMSHELGWGMGSQCKSARFSPCFSQ